MSSTNKIVVKSPKQMEQILRFREFDVIIGVHCEGNEK